MVHASYRTRTHDRHMQEETYYISMITVMDIHEEICVRLRFAVAN